MLEVLTPSALATLQDAGRRGWQAYGVPVSGPMDAFAQRAANLLVANPPEAAALEIGYSSAEFLALDDCLIAVTGPGFSLTVNGHPMRMWTSVYVRKNGRIRLEKRDSGNWAYLSAHGGIQTSLTLGSRSSYPPAHLGHAPLAPGDVLTIGSSRAHLPGLASRTLKSTIHYSPNPTIHVIPGPQSDYFSLTSFHASTYTISPTSDRTGYRLIGPPLERTNNSELISEGMARGCIQIPADGLPIVMQADCPTTGGYPKIASVIAADQPILAQVSVGTGQIRFVKTTIEQAQIRYREMINELVAAITQPSIDEYSW
jgi:antagonist of KipI